MKTAVRLGTPHHAACVFATLVAAGGCSFDARQLRVHQASDGAAEPPDISDAGASGSGGRTASDARTSTGGRGGGATSPPDARAVAGGSAIAGSGAFAASSFDAAAKADGRGGSTDGNVISGGHTGASGNDGAGAVGGAGGIDAGLSGAGGGGGGGIFGAGGTTSTATSPPPAGGLAVYVLEMNISPLQIGIDLRIDNLALQNIDLSTVTLRYWYQDEGLGTALAFERDYASIGLSGQGTVVGKSVAASAPVSGADHYLEFSFGGTLASQGTPYSSQFTFDGRAHTPSYAGPVDVTNDYSYNSGATGYNEKITLYTNGQLIWGIEP